MNESKVLARLRAIATHDAARGLLDDAAVLEGLVITHDSIAEGVHFFDFDPPASVGWKLVAVNLSDLAAKGALPVAALLSLTLSGDSDWELEFLSGVEAACESYGLSLIGGDTIALPGVAPRVLGMTAIGRAGSHTPSRAGAGAGDHLILVGAVGDAGAGLAELAKDRKATGALVDVYRRPVPLLTAGQALAPQVTAMMDVSDGLLLDALRMAQASGHAVTINLDAIELSEDFLDARGASREARLFAATAGDDYALLAALPQEADPSTICLPSGTTMQFVGSFSAGKPSIAVTSGGAPLALPERLGFEHSGHDLHKRAAPPGSGRA